MDKNKISEKAEGGCEFSVKRRKMCLWNNFEGYDKSIYRQSAMMEERLNKIMVQKKRLDKIMEKRDWGDE